MRNHEVARFGPRAMFGASRSALSGRARKPLLQAVLCAKTQALLIAVRARRWSPHASQAFKSPDQFDSTQTYLRMIIKCSYFCFAIIVRNFGISRRQAVDARKLGLLEFVNRDPPFGSLNAPRLSGNDRSIRSIRAIARQGALDRIPAAVHAMSSSQNESVERPSFSWPS